MSLDHDDYATLARIEDHLRRIADALEAPRTERLPELLAIAQRGLDRVAYSFRPAGSLDGSRLAMRDLAMELRDALDAKPCDDRTCTDRDHWAPRDPNRCDPGCTRPSLHDGDCTAAADPLDESDHRPRHFADGEHLYWVEGCGGWHLGDASPCSYPHAQADGTTLAAWVGPLTFCDCDATIEAENGATD